MIVNAMDMIVRSLALRQSRKDMNVMPLPLKGSGQLRHVNGHASHGD
jgi:hypothetical protein